MGFPWDSHDMSRLTHHRSNGESFLNAENVSDTAPPPSGKRPGEPGGASVSPAKWVMGGIESGIILGYTGNIMVVGISLIMGIIYGDSWDYNGTIGIILGLYRDYNGFISCVLTLLGLCLDFIWMILGFYWHYTMCVNIIGI